MKLFLRNKENFHPETVQFYEQNFELTNKPVDADVIVINDFEPIATALTPVACNSTGIDHIDAPEVISLRGEDLSDLTAVPELCLGMAIFLTRTYKKEEIKGKKLGIIGYGRIGKKFADMARYLGMDVYWYDVASNYKLDFILKNSDIVSLHITADEENRDWMDMGKFKLMKEGAIFLNSSRGWLVEERGLKWALENKLSAAWTDFETELYNGNLFITPHLGGSTKESRKKSEMLIANKLWERLKNS